MAPNMSSKAESDGDSTSDNGPLDQTSTGAENGTATEHLKEPEIFEDAVSETQCSSLPVFCWKEGLQVKQTARNVDAWVTLALTLDGRDKMTKMLQYVARFLTWWLAGKRSAERFKALKESLTTCRKAFRLGRSLIEIRKLQQLHVPQAVGVALCQSVDPVDATNHNDGATSKMTFDEMISSMSIRKCYRALYDKVYRPLVLRTCSLLLLGSDKSASSSISSPLWKTIGTAIKLAGLLGFWAGDNVSFLTSSGVLDDLRKNNDKNARLTRRHETSATFTKFANRSYFVGALAGLFVNVKVYMDHRENSLRVLQEKVDSEKGEERVQALKALETAKEQEFSLIVALMKSCSDVLVFSNNPGIDLWMKVRGAKLHEGIHCVGGLISASSVLYNNFPGKTK